MLSITISSRENRDVEREVDATLIIEAGPNGVFKKMSDFFKTRVFFKTYNNSPFIYVDYSHLRDLEMCELRLSIFSYLQNLENGSVRMLYNLSEIKPGMTAFQYANSTSKRYDIKICKSAVINLPHRIVPLYKVYQKLLNLKRTYLKQK